MKLTIKAKELRLLRLERVPLPQFATLDVEADRIVSKAGNGKVRTIKPAQQLEMLTKFAPRLISNHTFCISGHETDSTAKFVGAWMFAQLLAEYKKLAAKSDFAFGKPVWHPLTGSYKDVFRDSMRNGKSKPSAFLLTNVPSDSSQLKLEKLRDIMELYHDVPRIVVTTGMNPVEFFTSKLHYPLNGAILIANKSKRVTESI